jgi:sarcosine oxidase subunit gamma
MPVLVGCADGTDEVERARSLGLADFSAWPRVTVKGPRAAEFLQSQGVPVPGEILETASLAGGGLIGRTGGAEFFLEDGPGGNNVATIESALGAGGNGVYRVLRQDASIVLAGSRGAELLRHVSAYDFVGGETPGRMVFTRVANLSCMALSKRFNEIPAWQFCCDGTYGPYLWETLLEVAHEFGGGIIGLQALVPELAP